MMQHTRGTSRLGMHVVDGVLIAQAPDDFGDTAFLNLKRGVLACVHEASIRGVLIDVSTVRIIDSVAFGLLVDTARAAALLGARTVFAGFQPGVVAALMDLDVECGSIQTALTLEDGLDQLRQPPQSVIEAGEPDPSDEDAETATPQGDDERH